MNDTQEKTEPTTPIEFPVVVVELAGTEEQPDLIRTLLEDGRCQTFDDMESAETYADEMSERSGEDAQPWEIRTYDPLTHDDPRIFTVTDDGYVVDPDSGEIVGYAKAPQVEDDGQIVGFTQSNLWTPETDGDFEWLLGVLGERRAIESRFRARKGAMNDAQKVAKNEGDFWERKYDQPLRAYVEANAPRGKKSVKLANGTIKLRAFADKFALASGQSDELLVEFVKNQRQLGMEVKTKEYVDRAELFNSIMTSVSECRKLLGDEKSSQHVKKAAQDMLDELLVMIDHEAGGESISCDVGVK